MSTSFLKICPSSAEFEALKTACPFPVGAVFLTFAGADPSAYWPGTSWLQVETGRFLVASAGRTEGATGDASPNNGSATWYPIRETGGARNVTLTAAQSGVPAHNHGMGHNHPLNASGARFIGYNYAAIGKTGVGEIRATVASSGTNYVPRVSNANVDFAGWDNTGQASSTSTGSNTAAGASSSHENRPPYIAVAMWERTA